LTPQLKALLPQTLDVGYLELGTVAHVCKLSAWEDCELTASPGYILSLHLKKKKKKEKKNVGSL
jgi:hypothetical protein